MSRPKIQIIDEKVNDHLLESTDVIIIDWWILSRLDGL